jgi:hypothetical protein
MKAILELIGLHELDRGVIIIIDKYKKSNINYDCQPKIITSLVREK